MRHTPQALIPDRDRAFDTVERRWPSRSVETRKRLIRLLFRYLGAEAGLTPVNLEITLTETPRHNWGLHGVPGDELGLTYDVDV